MSEDAIVMEDVTFRYQSGASTQSITGLDQVSLQVPKGAVTLLCGASGSGKSSALRALNGLVPHFHTGVLYGRIFVAGTNPPQDGLAAVGRVAGTVFQNPRTQFFTTDVTSELAFRFENYGVPTQEIIAAIERAAAQARITHFLGRPVDELSGGEQQKVACAAAICGDSPVILFDEPTSNLSPEAIEDFVVLLAELKKQGVTIVIAEHRLHFLRNLVDQVLLFSDGSVSEIFTGQEFFALGDRERRDRGLRQLTRESGVASGELEPTPAKAVSGLEIKNLAFRYGRAKVLDVANLAFPRGEVSILIGPNGAGKSTLARVITGLAKPDKGANLFWDGQRTSTKDLLRRSYIVMQDVHRQLFSESVAAEVALGTTKGQLSETDVAALLAEFDLAEQISRHPLSLSGGQKQRLVIASAVAAQKELYVFDEPTSGVDYRHLVAIGNRLRQLARQGAAVIVITHDAELIDECADRVVRLEPLPDGNGMNRTTTQRYPTHDERKIHAHDRNQ